MQIRVGRRYHVDARDCCVSVAFDARLTRIEALDDNKWSEQDEAESDDWYLLRLGFDNGVTLDSPVAVDNPGGAFTDIGEESTP